jgi:transcriptional regulator NrdR family protein
MKCPICEAPTVVLQTRTIEDGITRRRKCEGDVAHRFTTHELLSKHVYVRTSDQARQQRNTEIRNDPRAVQELAKAFQMTPWSIRRIKKQTNLG